MSINKTYQSEVFEAVHETVVDMFDADLKERVKRYIISNLKDCYKNPELGFL